jgi:hypothetical protein
VASTPTTVPWITVPFFNSIVTCSRFSFCRNLTSFIVGYVFYSSSRSSNESVDVTDSVVYQQCCVVKKRLSLRVVLASWWMADGREQTAPTKCRTPYRLPETPMSALRGYRLLTLLFSSHRLEGFRCMSIIKHILRSYGLPHDPQRIKFIAKQTATPSCQLRTTILERWPRNQRARPSASGSRYEIDCWL